MNKKKAKPILRRPSQVYQQCPACKTKNLIRMDIDVLCAECDWNSIESFVDAGGMAAVSTTCKSS